MLRPDRAGSNMRGYENRPGVRIVLRAGKDLFCKVMRQKMLQCKQQQRWQQRWRARGAPALAALPIHRHTPGMRRPLAWVTHRVCACRPKASSFVPP
jgi:hypothetical protein